MIFSRTIAGSPTIDTFDCPPIAGFVDGYLQRSKISVDPFARNKKWFTHTNDLDPSTTAANHVEASLFCASLFQQGVNADLVVFDPPYTINQIAECYASAGESFSGAQSIESMWNAWRDSIAKLCASGAIVLSFGWNTNGMGEHRGFEISEVMLVSHGGVFNDTICMAERKLLS